MAAMICRAVDGNWSRVKSCIVSKMSIRKLSSKTSDSTVDLINPTIDRVRYVTQRQDYNNKMTELRKQWKQEFLEKRAREDEQRRLERERLVRERAVRLRERREISLIKQAADRKAKAEALARYR